MVGGVMELDLHGMNTYQAQIAIDAALRRCGGGGDHPRLPGRHRHPGYAVDGVQQAQSSETPCQYQ
mgnify:CR=1 FL=1